MNTPFSHEHRQFLSVLLSILLLPGFLPAQERPNPTRLNIVIVEGGGAVNNIQERVAREPIVQVEDENRKPVAGAVVVFLLPNQGAGGAFADGANSLTVTTDESGRAVARGFRPNNNIGNYTVRVRASLGGVSTSTNISMSNAAGVGAGAGGAAAAGISAKALAIIAVAAAAAVTGVVIGVTRGGNNGAAPSVPVTVTPGSPTVGPPRQ
jgi:hypothetical protein